MSLIWLYLSFQPNVKGYDEFNYWQREPSEGVIIFCAWLCFDILVVWFLKDLKK